MSTKIPQNQTDQEVDLAQISKSFKNLLQDLKRAIYRSILFFIKNIITLFVILLLGFGLGLVLDKTQKDYSHQIIVTPNFGSTEFLYSKVNLIKTKIKENDTLFLKNIVGIKNVKDLESIEIDPIVNVYDFVQKRTENFELIKLMSENNDIKNVIRDNTTSKNYGFHRIDMTTKNETNNRILIEPLLHYLNESEHFEKIQKVEYQNILEKIKQNEVIISQINGFLDGFSNSVNTPKNDKLIYYNENSQLNDVIKTKENLIEQQGKNKVELISSDKIIKESSVTLNRETPKYVKGLLKFILPMLFIFLFYFFIYLKRLYKNEAKN